MEGGAQQNRTHPGFQDHNKVKLTIIKLSLSAVATRDGHTCLTVKLPQLGFLWQCLWDYLA